MRPALVMLVILIVLLLAAEVMIKLLAKKYMDQMAECLYKKDLAAFDALTGKKLVQLTVPPFNFHYMRLQRYYMVNDEKNIEKIFEMFDQVKLNGQQKTEVLVNGFQYYLNKKNKEKASSYLEKLKNTNIDQQVITNYERLIRVFIDDDTSLLETLLEETEGLEDRYKGNNEYMIARIYQNLHKKDLAKEYQRRAEQHTRQFNEEINKTKE